MGRGPAWPIKFREDGPQPGPAHQNFRGSAAARPSQSRFKFFKGRPDRSIFQTSRPGPSELKKSRPSPGRPVTLFRSARPGPAQTNDPRQAQKTYLYILIFGGERSACFLAQAQLVLCILIYFKYAWYSNATVLRHYIVVRAWYPYHPTLYNPVHDTISPNDLQQIQL